MVLNTIQMLAIYPAFVIAFVIICVQWTWSYVELRYIDLLWCLRDRSECIRSYAVGGGPSKCQPVFKVGQVANYCVVYGDMSRLHRDVTLQFLRFVDTSSIEELRSMNAVVVDLPMRFLLNTLPFQHLLQLAHHHAVHVPRSRRSVSGVMELLLDHQCSVACVNVWCAFIIDEATAVDTYDGSTDSVVVSSEWLANFEAIIEPFSAHPERTLTFYGISTDSKLADVLRSSSTAVAFRIPLVYLASIFPNTNL